MVKRFLVTSFLLLLLIGGIYGVWGWHVYQAIQKFSNYRPPAVSVATQVVQSEPWESHLETIGTLESTHGISITPETAGIVSAIAVESGHYVKAGQRLFQLNDRVEQADLRKAQAEAKLAAINYKRLKNLVAKHAAPSSSYDKAVAEQQQANAIVEKINALIAQKHIRAPFAGKLGILNVHLGQYVTPNSRNLVTLQSLNPLYVRFSVPAEKRSMLNVNQTVQLTLDSKDKTTYPGKITAIDSTVDIKTHNLAVQAIVPNPELKLYPGLFTNVSINTQRQVPTIVVPKIAVTFSLYGNMVYVITSHDNEKFVDRRYVKTGEQRNGKIAILSGLKVGDEVVTAGHQKLHHQARVVIDKQARLK